MYEYIFFIYLSVDGHLGYFCILTILNNVGMIFGVHISFWISVFGFLDIYLAVELLGLIIILLLVFWEISILFSTVSMQVYYLFSFFKYTLILFIIPLILIYSTMYNDFLCFIICSNFIL